jgi:DNA replication protein DnaC
MGVIDDFNFTYQSSLRLHMLGSTLTPDVVTEGRSLILAGKPGRGKTHLAIAIAYRAIQNDFDAFFTTAAALIDGRIQIRTPIWSEFPEKGGQNFRNPQSGRF